MCGVTDLLQLLHPVLWCHGMPSPSGSTWEVGRGREEEGGGEEFKEEGEKGRRRVKEKGGKGQQLSTKTS